MEKRYAMVRRSPLPDDDRPEHAFFRLTVPAEDVHRRLMRLLPTVPNVAVFPWMIAPLQETGIAYFRRDRMKEGDDRFYFPLSRFLGWELGRRKLRIGIVESTAKNRSFPSHIWVLGLVSRKKGKDLIILDDSSEDVLAATNDKPSLEDILRSQRDLKSILVKHYGFNIKRVLWGGRSADVDLKGDGLCLEASVRFVERFSKQVEDCGGEVEEELLARWKLREMGWNYGVIENCPLQLVPPGAPYA